MECLLAERRMNKDPSKHLWVMLLYILLSYPIVWDHIYPVAVPFISFCCTGSKIYSCVKLLKCLASCWRFILSLQKLSPHKRNETVKRKLFLNLCLFWQTALQRNIFHRNDWHNFKQMSIPAHSPDVKEKPEISVNLLC